MSHDLDVALSALRATLDQFEAGQITPDVVCVRFRLSALQWPGLPDRYAAVLERLLQPLDTSAMLGDESCSFSRADVLQALRQWLDHAGQLSR